MDRPSSGGGGARQLAAVSGMSVGCLLDGIVIAYSSPAIPSLLAEVTSQTFDQHFGYRLTSPATGGISSQSSIGTSVSHFNCRAQELIWIIITFHGLVSGTPNYPTKYQLKLQMLQTSIFCFSTICYKSLLNVTSTKPHLMQTNFWKDFRTYFIWFEIYPGTFLINANLRMKIIYLEVNL